MLFGNNKKEIEDLQKKVDRAISDICQLQHEQELLRTNQNSLRGLINRKIVGADQEMNQTENKDPRTTMLLPER